MNSHHLLNIKPSSALLLPRAGTRDPRSLHGACPSCLGVKWVANKWVREGSQWRRRPCL